MTQYLDDFVIPGVSVQSDSFIYPDRPAVKRAGLWLQRPLAWRSSPEGLVRLARRFDRRAG